MYQAGYEWYDFDDYASQARTNPRASYFYFYEPSGQKRYDDKGRKQQKRYEEHTFKQEEDDTEYKEKLKEKLRKEREEQEKQQRREKERKRKEQEQEREQKQREQDEQERKQREQEKERKKREERERKQREQEEQERKQREQEKERKKREEEEEARERMRQQARQQREERERKERDEAMRNRREWQQAWQTYVTRWAAFKKAETKPTDLLQAQKEIPWPTKTGRLGDVNRTNVMKFYQNACPDDGTPAMSKTMRFESLKWHPDKMFILYPSCTPGDVDKEVVGMICRVVLDLKQLADAKKST